MSQPEKVKGSYLGPANGGRPEPPSAVEMMKYQLMAPEYREGNLTILKASAMFVVGILFVRSSLGSVLVPVL